MKKIRRFPLSQHAGSPAYGIGLLTDEPDYRLCWLLNQAYPWDLIRSDDLITHDKNSPLPQSYACFESNSSHQPAIRLIGNRSQEGMWLTVFRQVNFLLAVSDQDSGGQYLDELKSTIGVKIPQIRGVFKVPLPSFCYL
jgi:hypothetical protein